MMTEPEIKCNSNRLVSIEREIINIMHKRDRLIKEFNDDYEMDHEKNVDKFMVLVAKLGIIASHINGLIDEHYAIRQELQPEMEQEINQ